MNNTETVYTVLVDNTPVGVFTSLILANLQASKLSNNYTIISIKLNTKCSFDQKIECTKKNYKNISSVSSNDDPSYNSFEMITECDNCGGEDCKDYCVNDNFSD